MGLWQSAPLVPVLPVKMNLYAESYCIRDIQINGSLHRQVSRITMSLMAAGVPIHSAVAGISAGLVTGDTDDDYLVLTDIQGLEDFFGDMDFKVAGTHKGITAIQMDIKIHGLTRPIIEEAIAATKKARTYILDEVMSKAISEPRPEVGPYAPKIIQMNRSQRCVLMAREGRQSTLLLRRLELRSISQTMALYPSAEQKQKEWRERNV